MTRQNGSAFLSAAGILAVTGTVLATVTPILAGAPRAFIGSVVTSGLLGLVFAGQNALVFRNQGRVSPPAAVVTTVFGGWFMAAPLLYDVGFLATAGTQLAGLIVASFAFYMTVAAVAGEA